MAITGAAGRIGSVLRVALREDFPRVVLVDRQQCEPVSRAEEARQADLRDAKAVLAALEDADAVVHLGGIPDEAPLPELVESNILGTHNVLEAARRHGLRRIVVASTNRVTGFYQVRETVTPEMPVRPDGLYAVSKVAVEALSRMYADKFGLSIVCLRIGSFEDAPHDQRHLSTWLSPRDCAGFVRAALTARDVRFAVAYAASANTRGFWDLEAGARLGYVPADNAESFATAVPGGESPAGNEPQSAPFAAPEFTGRHLRNWHTPG